LILRSESGVMAVPLKSVLGIRSMVGDLPPEAPQGLGAHLRGPVQVDKRQVSVLDPEGLIRFLTPPS
jgi:hypothetical protein